MGYESFPASLTGRVAIVTGANSGMGKETARELARMGADVILACRSMERGRPARDEIVATTGNDDVALMQLDLSYSCAIVPSTQADTSM